MDLCCCTPPCKPRYRRLVDDIYIRSNTDGLHKSNMQKLTFYVLSQPEKLDRIGEYILLRLSRDLYRQRYEQVKVSVEAMDQLLQSCHVLSSLNQFIESFLKMLQKLLETNNLQMEKLATDSFVNFANIEENTPAYHREYDFFISKFASMCFSNDPANAKAIRYAGLKGLRGVVWKSASDPLQVSIWEKQHMCKIIPSILLNLEDDEEKEENNEEDHSFLTQRFQSGLTDSLKALSDQFLRELMGKAPFGLISVIEPVLSHCDSHNKWEPPALFASHVFGAIMFSIKDPSFVIQALINHLETKSNSNASTRIGIATVLSSIVSRANACVGPSLLGIFNSLLKHLRQSVEFRDSEECPSIESEEEYQNTLINAMGDYANALPDYQKIDIMMLTVESIPRISGGSYVLKPGEAYLQRVLVKTLLKVATKYKTAYFSAVFTDPFLKTLLQLALVSDSSVRLNTQSIFHTLLDRHDNLGLLSHLPYLIDIDNHPLMQRCSRADQMFMRSHITSFTAMLYKTIFLAPEDATLQDHIDAALCTMALLCVEVRCDDVLIELLRLAFALQRAAMESVSVFANVKRVLVHNLVAKYLNFSSHLIAIPSVCQYVQRVLKQRTQLGASTLNLLSPALEAGKAGNGDNVIHNESLEKQCLRKLVDDPSLTFSRNDFAEMLKLRKDVQRLLVSFIPKGRGLNVESNDNSVDNSQNLHLNVRQAETEEVSFSLDSSFDGSPPESRSLSRRNTIFSNHDNELTGDILRKTLNASIDLTERERLEKEKSSRIIEKFRNEDFDDLVNEIHRANERADLSKAIKRLLKKGDERIVTEQPTSIFEVTMPYTLVE
uniref:Non-specific serine/threonine protein kinase n=1 Tax=Syphacia muris TaxID=451379 RepID=A0A0N5AA46_9BILA